MREERRQIWIEIHLENVRLVFSLRPNRNGVVTRTSVPPFFGFVRSVVRSASKMIVLMPRLRKRPKERRRGEAR